MGLLKDGPDCFGVGMSAFGELCNDYIVLFGVKAFSAVLAFLHVILGTLNEKGLVKRLHDGKQPFIVRLPIFIRWRFNQANLINPISLGIGEKDTAEESVILDALSKRQGVPIVLGEESAHLDKFISVGNWCVHRSFV